MGKRDPRVDAYIAGSAEFARPILAHLRKMVHAGCPEVEETLRLPEGGSAQGQGEGYGPARRAGSKPNGDRKLDVPDYFMSVLRRRRKALAIFEEFSYTNKKDYVEWVTEAKGEETRRRRLEAAVAWMAEGKIRNWKYLRKS
jgi:hypothetical protein